MKICQYCQKEILSDEAHTCNYGFNSVHRAAFNMHKLEQLDELINSINRLAKAIEEKSK